MKHNYQVIFKNTVTNNEHGLMLIGITPEELSNKLANNSVFDGAPSKFIKSKLIILAIEDYGEYK